MSEDNYFNKATRLIHSILSKRPDIYIHCLEVLGDPFWQNIPSSMKYHHVYQHGNFIHTSEVLSICDAVCNLPGSDEIDKDVLYLSAIWHDYGKIRDYEFDNEKNEWVYSNHHRLIRHLPASYQMFLSYWNEVLPIHKNLSKKQIENVCHCLLSHHGRKEWGSPVEPETPEAHILHQADMMSIKSFITRKDVP